MTRTLEESKRLHPAWKGTREMAPQLEVVQGEGSSEARTLGTLVLTHLTGETTTVRGVPSPNLVGFNDGFYTFVRSDGTQVGIPIQQIVCYEWTPGNCGGAASA